MSLSQSPFGYNYNNLIQPAYNGNKKTILAIIR